MSRPPAWEPLETEILADCRVFEVARTRTRSPHNGEVYDFFRIEAGDWVNVVPITENDEVVMVAQYRHGADRVMLETPGGMVDPGEDPAVAAARELLEETGYRAASVERLGGVNPNPALFGNRLHLFLARDVVWQQAIQNSEREETSVELVPLREISERVLAGEIDHALVVAAFYWFEKRAAAAAT